MGVPGAAPWARGRPPPIVLVVCLHVALMFYLVCMPLMLAYTRMYTYLWSVLLKSIYRPEMQPHGSRSTLPLKRRSTSGRIGHQPARETRIPEDLTRRTRTG